jgi:hypothetical protein
LAVVGVQSPAAVAGVVYYARAVDGKEFGSFESPDMAADALLGLAREHDLAPSFMILFEEEG